MVAESAREATCDGNFDLNHGDERVLYSDNDGSKLRCNSRFTSPVGTTMSLECPQFNLNARGCQREQLKVKAKGRKATTYCGTSGPSLTTPKNRIRVTYKRKPLREGECSGGYLCFLRVLGDPPATTPTTSPPATPAATTVSAVGDRLFCPEECGRANLTVPRIVGGQVASRLEYPWMAYITITGGGGQDTSCGGAIVNSEHVVTAAHCFGDRNLATSTVTVFLAEHDIDILTETDVLSIFAQELFIHPDYKADGQDTEEHDIALLYLGGSLTFGVGVQPICLGTADDFAVGQEAVIVGWGLTDFANASSASNLLREVAVSTIDIEQCITLYQNAAQRQFVNENMICTLTPGKDACSGDSGGPVITRVGDVWVLIGIVSFGNGCAEPDAPGVHTNVANYLDWMTESVGGAFC
ncbi:tryptase-like [Penaeus chinensis]|uniref:tryptase-like n=1 Tax=Penaeus chinensis TaxID=139456 RepID=UPI001FB769F8|nr:tryptase-like [Penaeus chinensis]